MQQAMWISDWRQNDPEELAIQQTVVRSDTRGFLQQSSRRCLIAEDDEEAIPPCFVRHHRSQSASQLLDSRIGRQINANGDVRHERCVEQKVGEAPHRARCCLVRENDEANNIETTEHGHRCRRVGVRCDGHVGNASVTCAVA